MDGSDDDDDGAWVAPAGEDLSSKEKNRNMSQTKAGIGAKGFSKGLAPVTTSTDDL
jgi:hypothetical protein